MKCKFCQLETLKTFCNTKCKMAYIGKKNPPVQVVQVVQAIQSFTNYKVIEGMVYGRRAVIFNGESITRPEPQEKTNTPDKDNRRIYYRHDGTRYLFDDNSRIIDF